MALPKIVSQACLPVVHTHRTHGMVLFDVITDTFGPVLLNKVVNPKINFQMFDIRIVNLQKKQVSLLY